MGVQKNRRPIIAPNFVDTQGENSLKGEEVVLPATATPAELADGTGNDVRAITPALLKEAIEALGGGGGGGTPHHAIAQGAGGMSISEYITTTVTTNLGTMGTTELDFLDPTRSSAAEVFKPADSQIGWDANGNGRFLVADGAETRTYRVTAQIVSADQSGKIFTFSVLKNGVEEVASNVNKFQRSVSTNSYQEVNLNWVGELAAGDTISFGARYNSISGTSHVDVAGCFLEIKALN